MLDLIRCDGGYFAVRFSLNDSEFWLLLAPVLIRPECRLFSLQRLPIDCLSHASEGGTRGTIWVPCKVLPPRRKWALSYGTDEG